LLLLLRMAGRPIGRSKADNYTGKPQLRKTTRP